MNQPPLMDARKDLQMIQIHVVQQVMMMMRVFKANQVGVAITVIIFVAKSKCIVLIHIELIWRHVVLCIGILLGTNNTINTQ